MADASELLDRTGEAMAAGRSRRVGGFLDKFVSALATLLGLYILLYVGDVFSTLRIVGDLQERVSELERAVTRLEARFQAVSRAAAGL